MLDLLRAERARQHMYLMTPHLELLGGIKADLLVPPHIDRWIQVGDEKNPHLGGTCMGKGPIWDERVRAAAIW